jgi:predicted dehydrogenase
MTGAAAVLARCHAAAARDGKRDEGNRMARKRVRIGLIGCGGNMRIAHIPRLQHDSGAEVVCVAEPVDEAVKLMFEKLGRIVPAYQDWRQMIAKEPLDAVLISTPHNQHYDQARACLNKDLHVLIEKPLTPSAKQNKALIDLARKRGKILEVAYQRCFMPEYAFGRDVVRQGKLGKVHGIVGYVTQGWIRAGGWRKDPVQAGGGMMMDTGSHLVAIMLWVTGLKPVEVSAMIDNCGEPVDISSVVSIRFDNGAIGTLNFIGNTALHDERLAIHGDAGCLVYQQHQWRMQSVLLNGEPAKIAAKYKESSPDAAFLHHIRTGGKGYESPVFAVEVAHLTEAAYKSAKAGGKPVRVA